MTLNLILGVDFRSMTVGAVFILFFTALSTPQEVGDNAQDNLINGMGEAEISKRIFSAERDTLSRIRQYKPIIETYVQSLWPDTNAQVPLGDVYFLSKVDFGNYLESEDYAKTMLFGSSNQSRKLLNDNGQLSTINPDGFISMLFVDEHDFDADTYRLKYLKSVTLRDLSCLTFAVTPIKKTTPGRFVGTIWVDNNGFRIVKVQGTFTATKLRFRSRLRPFGETVEIFFRFKCWREKLVPDLWVPAYAEVDDNVGWKEFAGDGTTDVHYRGRTAVWGYSTSRSVDKSKFDIASRSRLDIGELQRNGLLAPLGSVDESLSGLMQKISAGGLDLPKVTVRILTTTPIELSHVDDTIIVSRGLLEMVPDEEVLSALLAHEWAHIAREKSKDTKSSATKNSSLDNIVVKGTDLVPEAEEEQRTAATTCAILGNGYAIDRARRFLEQLASLSKSIPNLTTSRFGRGLVDSGGVIHNLVPCGTQSSVLQLPTLQLRGRFLVDVSTGKLQLPN